jgi:membrane associated rhomboid family serine protease
LTCHLVHFTHKQLLLKVVFFAILAAMVELQIGRIYLLLLYACLALAITLLLPFVRPSMVAYGGLSGINYGLLVCVALQALSRSETRFTGLIVLLFVGLNLTFQAVTGTLLVSYDYAGLNIEPVWEAHLAGCLMALLYYAAAFIPVIRQSINLRARFRLWSA